MVMSKNPGQIIKEYTLDFQDKISKDKEYIATLDPEFIKIKNDILHLIS